MSDDDDLNEEEIEDDLELAAALGEDEPLDEGAAEAELPAEDADGVLPPEPPPKKKVGGKKAFLHLHNDAILAQLRQGKTTREIAETLGLAYGSVRKQLDELKPQIRKMNREMALKAMQDPARTAVREPGAQIPGPESVGEEVEAILKKALPKAAQLVLRSVSNLKLEPSALQSAKILLAKFGMLKEDAEVKESQYAKMGSEELLERLLASAVSLMKSKGRADLAAISETALDAVKKIREESLTKAA